jgi:hypothetical protein
MPRLLAVAILSVLVAALARTEADPDLWGHVLGGRDVVEHAGVPRTDPHSFTSDRPWMKHDWLGEVVLWETWQRTGTPGLVALKLVLATGTLALVAAAVLPRAMSPPLTAVVLVVWMAGAAPMARTLRPQLFSLVGFAALLHVLARGRGPWLLAVPPLFAVWANLHGGWMLGMGLLGLWAACTTAREGPRVDVALVVAASLLATLLTPFGTSLWHFFVESILPGQPDVGEWRSLRDAGSARLAVWAASVALAAAAIGRSRPRPSAFAVLAVAGLALAAFRSTRLGAFFATAVPILLAPQLAGLAPARPRRPAGTAAIAVAAATVVAAAAVAAPSFRCIAVEATWAPDFAAARFLRTNAVRGRMITWYDWGSYATWQLGPGIRVSMDPRRETVYSEATLAAHRALYAGTPEGVAFLDRLEADWAWLPRGVPVVAHLVPPRWHVVFETPQSVVAARTPAADLTPPGSAPAPRCFPADP